MIYTCKRCSSTATAEDIEQIIEREKLCVPCSRAKNIAICPNCGVEVFTTVNHVKTKRCEECAYKDYLEKLTKARVADKKEYKRVTPTYDLVCEHCKEPFTTSRTTVRFCKKPECVQIGVKIRKLERDAVAISKLQKISTITVYGANVNKMQKYVNDKSRKRTD